MPNDQSPISTEHQIAHWALEHLLALHKLSPGVAVAVADAFLEAVAPRFPECAPFWGEGQREADWWAECAPDSALSYVLQGCAKRLALGRMLLPVNARKRALVAIWNSLPPADKTAFIDFIEPPPGARG